MLSHQNASIVYLSHTYLPPFLFSHPHITFLSSPPFPLLPFLSSLSSLSSSLSSPHLPFFSLSSLLSVTAHMLVAPPPPLQAFGAPGKVKTHSRQHYSVPKDQSEDHVNTMEPPPPVPLKIGPLGSLPKFSFASSLVVSAVSSVSASQAVKQMIAYTPRGGGGGVYLYMH